MEFIYVLKCQLDKYFIWKTYNVQIEYLSSGWCGRADLGLISKALEIELPWLESP